MQTLVGRKDVEVAVAAYERLSKLGARLTREHREAVDKLMELGRKLEGYREERPPELEEKWFRLSELVESLNYQEQEFWKWKRKLVESIGELVLDDGPTERSTFTPEDIFGIELIELEAKAEVYRKLREALLGEA